MQTAAANESDLINSLIWSKLEYSLAEFINEYPLPQVVCVVDGYYSSEEEMCFGAHQVLALHEKAIAQKVIGTDILGRVVAIPSRSSTKVEVYALKFNGNCKVKDLKSLYRGGVGYARVESTSETNESIRVGDLLQVKKIDKKNKLVFFQNVESEQDVTLSFTCSATFTPLLDCKSYSVSEINETFGFPTRVRFLNGNKYGRRNTQHASPSTCHGEVVLVKEVTENIVISTTVGDESVEKRCIALPVDLPLKFVVAEGFTKGGGNYEEVVRTLDTNYKDTKLGDFDQLNLSQHLHAVKNYDYTTSDETLPSSLPTRTSRRLTKAATKSNGTLSIPAVPTLPPGRCLKPEVHNTRPLPSSAKQTKTISKTSKKRTKTSETLQQLSSTYEVPMHSPSSHSDDPQIGKADGENLDNNLCDYVEMDDTMRPNIYEYADVKVSIQQEFALKTMDNNPPPKQNPAKETLNHDEENQTLDNPPPKQNPAKENLNHDEENQKMTNIDIQKGFKETSQRNQDVSEQMSLETSRLATQNASNSTSAQLGSGDLSEMRRVLSDENEDHYKRISLIPEDLSSLTVGDVGHVLRCLNMETYVKIFEEEMIDGAILKDFDFEILQSLTMTLFHRKKLMKFIDGWRPKK